MEQLVALHAAVEARTRSTADTHPWWPCRKGCDDCCRRLAAAPVLTEPEWVLVREALTGLPEAVRSAVERRIAMLSDVRQPIVCPMLDTACGACLIYDARPVACRTYGFYVDREGGLYCPKIEDAAASAAGIIWGNQEAVESRLDAIGTRLPITDWFARDRR
jgi:Fe-S-cluster containining protein